MPGQIRLGALLGTNMSFQTDAPSSWAYNLPSSLYFNQPSRVHSSGCGARVDVDSGDATGMLISNPALPTSPLCPDVAAHGMELRFWGSTDRAASSGQFFITYNTGSAAVGFVGSGQLLAVVVSGGVAAAAPALEIHHTVQASGQLYLDDFLPMVDVIDLHPDWESTFDQPVLRQQNTAQDGTTQGFRYGHCFEFAFTCRFVPASVAAVVNWWWAQQIPLALCLSEEATEEVYLCRLTNPVRPFNETTRPNQGLYLGYLQLNGLSPGGSLEY